MVIQAAVAVGSLDQSPLSCARGPLVFQPQDDAQPPPYSSIFHLPPAEWH